MKYNLNDRCNNPIYLVISIGIIIIFSSILYIDHLGFYSDDWWFLSVLDKSEQRSITNLFSILNIENPLRPVKSIYQASLYLFFGLQPLYYHIVNHSVFLLIVIMQFIVLRKLGVSLTFAFVIAVIYSLLPNYSSTRFWYAANQANLSAILYLISLYSDIKSIENSSYRFWFWKLVSLISITLSILAYEVLIPLFVFNLYLIWYKSKNISTIKPVKGLLDNWYTNCSINLSLILIIAFYKISMSDRIAENIDYLSNFQRLMEDIVRIHLIGFGFNAPLIMMKIFYNYLDGRLLIIGLLTSLFVFIVIYSRLRSGDDLDVKPGCWVRLGAVGAVVLFVGYAAAIFTTDIGFVLTGVNNRTAFASTFGFALILTGMSGLICSAIPGYRIKRAVFSMLVSFVCFYGVIVINVVAEFWIKSYHEQNNIIEALEPKAAGLPPQSVLILDGICPYIGPGIVFETYWDLEGVLALNHRNKEFRGDVIKHDTDIDERGISTNIYGISKFYPYNEQLYLYNYEKNKIYNLSSYQVAKVYFDEQLDKTMNRCPKGVEGEGVRIF